MNFTALKEGTPYIITKGSDDGSLQVGDQVTLLAEGALENLPAEGWLEPGPLLEAVVGAEFEVDRLRIQRRKESLLRRLAALETEDE